VLAMLPEPRRSAVQACLAQSKPEERLAAFRERERLRVARLGRTRFGTAWDRLDPRLREAWLRTQR